MDKEGIKKLISEIPLFDGFCNDEIDSMADLLEYKKETKGSVIIGEGEVDSTLYYIASGEVEVCVNTKNASEAALVQRRKGETIGEMALFGTNNKRSATVVALSPAEFLLLSKKNYEDIIEKHPIIAFKIQKSIVTNLCKRIKELSDEVAYSRLIG